MVRSPAAVKIVEDDVGMEGWAACLYGTIEQWLCWNKNEIFSFVEIWCNEALLSKHRLRTIFDVGSRV